MTIPISWTSRRPPCSSEPPDLPACLSRPPRRAPRPAVPAIQSVADVEPRTEPRTDQLQDLENVYRSSTAKDLRTAISLRSQASSTPFPDSCRSDPGCFEFRAIRSFPLWPTPGGCCPAPLPPFRLSHSSIRPDFPSMRRLVADGIATPRSHFPSVLSEPPNSLARLSSVSPPTVRLRRSPCRARDRPCPSVFPLRDNRSRKQAAGLVLATSNPGSPDCVMGEALDPVWSFGNVVARVCLSSPQGSAWRKHWRFLL